MKNIFTKFFLVLFTFTILLTSTSFQGNKEEENSIALISRKYKSYNLYKGAHKDSALLNWTIALCAPMNLKNIIHEFGDSVQISSAKKVGQGLHGNKLYKFYVKDLKSYCDTLTKTQPIGQILVKETWNIREIPKDSVLKSKLLMK